MNMTEAKIILPVVDNDGHSLKYKLREVEARIFDLFGGFTRTQAEGAWCDPDTGESNFETVNVYVIAGKWDDAQVLALINLAAGASKEMNQICVYVCVKGEVYFVGSEQVLQSYHKVRKAA
jgi:hypothetical protein